MTKILPCKCTHEYQDARYGAGMRVFNQMKSTKGLQSWRCTVCSQTKDA